MFKGCGVLFLWTIFIISYDEIFQLNLSKTELYKTKCKNNHHKWH